MCDMSHNLNFGMKVRCHWQFLEDELRDETGDESCHVHKCVVSRME